MAKLANRAKMTVSGTPGTGTITLSAAVPGFQTFTAAGILNADLVSYVIEDGNNWECGTGTYTSAGTTLARTTVTASSNAGSAINASSLAIVYIAALAADLTRGTAAGNLLALDGSAKIPAVDASQVTGLTPANLTEATSAPTTNYTLVIGDQGTLVRMTVATANTCTVPPNSSVAFPLNKSLDVCQYGAGQTTITAGAGVTLQSTPGLKLRAQYSCCSLYKVATDTWLVFGDLSA
jgi:hypothetical protein